MTDADAATVQAVHDVWDGRLRLVHITVVDEDGDGYPVSDVDRWVIEVRVPVSEDEQDAVPVAQVTAFTVQAPEDLSDLAESFHLADAAGDYASAVAVHDADGGSFLNVFAGAATVLGLPDLLIIDQIRIPQPYRTLPGLMPAIISAVRGGPAGRTAAFVLTDPTVWGFHPSDDELNLPEFAQWADTSVLVSMNADPRLAMQLTEEALSTPTPPAGARSDDVWLDDIVQEAMTQPAIGVPFTLPPALPTDVWAAAPDDIHAVTADDTTGTVTIETHDTTYEVVGMPGNAPQLVGAAADAPEATQAWLRAVHQRWWQYEPDLHNRIHDVINAYLAGTLDTITAEETPHLHVPNLPIPIAPWPTLGTVQLEPAGEDTEPQVFDAVLEHGGSQEHIGAVTVHESGHVQAFLHDEWRPDYPDHEQAVAHLLAAGAREYLSAVLHNELSAAVEHAILTGDVRGH
ncbi:hypothetical protein [Curtobacterium sp. MCBD17_040]|uniref:hypothetical protein n=1 Tax=Curtobacterium sp. MCBD17_040 TaxID=2175674 RepID=UPI0011B84D2E|nr:hypothetical protein [Curtobacterium sp. MCBD17_040]WIB65754.1 hypothetical protein DEI94_16685 [Curtobacterium sp. MCBD17_040]